MQILVITRPYPATDDAEAKRIANAITKLRGMGHQLSVLTTSDSSGEVAPEITIRRALLPGGLLHGTRNMAITAGVIDVCDPDIVLVWSAGEPPKGAVRAAALAGRNIVFGGKDSDAVLGNLGLGIPRGAAFSPADGVMATLEGKNKPFARFEQIPAADLDGDCKQLEHFLAAVHAAKRFDRYKAISDYKQNPRPYLVEDEPSTHDDHHGDGHHDDHHHHEPVLPTDPVVPMAIIGLLTVGVIMWMMQGAH